MRNLNDLHVASIFILLLFTMPCMACSCASTPINERFDEFQYVFSAEIVAAELLDDPNSPIRSNGDKIQIKTGTRDDFKADSSALKFLYTNSAGSACGINVTIGHIHTFLVNENGHVSLCGSVVRQEENAAFYQLLKDRSLTERR